MGDVLGEISARAVATTRFGQTRPPTVYFVRVTLNRDKIDKEYREEEEEGKSNNS